MRGRHDIYKLPGATRTPTRTAAQNQDSYNRGPHSGLYAAFDHTHTPEYATKRSSVDAGYLGQMAYDDDYWYICTKEGTAGNAIWKRSVLFLTT